MSAETSSIESSADSITGLSTGSAAIPQPATLTSKERWAAWEARGAAHDRTVRRRLTIALPLLVLAAAVIYALLLR